MLGLCCTCGMPVPTTPTHGDLCTCPAVHQEKGAQLKLIDFGLSTKYSKATSDSTLAGTIYYIAPEVLQKKVPSCWPVRRASSACGR